MSTGNGGPAFPAKKPLTMAGGYDSQGMSLRDWFAGQALAGWLASYGDRPHPAMDDDGGIPVAANAYRMADAMLKARGA